MVNYFASATALLSLASLVTGASAINAAETSSQSHGLRKLYETEAKKDTITEEKCEEVISGSPPICTKVCVVVTSTKKGDEVIDEYSKVTQSKCEPAAEVRTKDEMTEWPTYSPTQETTYSPTKVTNSPTQSPTVGDVPIKDEEYEVIVKDSWKCASKPEKVS